MNEPKKPIEVRYETLVIIWLSLLISQALFLAVIGFVKPELMAFDLTQPIFGDQALIVLVFAFGGIAAFVLGLIFRNQHIARAIADRDAGCVQTGLVLGCAFSEASSLLGVILALVFEYPYFWAWIGLGLIGVLIHFPRRGNLEAAQFRR